MAIAQKVAGFTLGQADILRRAMGKKKKSELDKQYEGFRPGMQANGYSDAAVKTLWDILLPFSDYAFNKAHSAAYGLVSYWTAYLKAHYPAEYMAALLTSVGDAKDKLGGVPQRVPPHGHQGAAAGRQRVDAVLRRRRRRHPLRARRRPQRRRERRRRDRCAPATTKGASPSSTTSCARCRPWSQQAHRRVADQGRRVRLARPPRAARSWMIHEDAVEAAVESSARRRPASSASFGSLDDEPGGRRGRRARTAGVGQEGQARVRARDARPLRLRPPAAGLERHPEPARGHVDHLADRRGRPAGRGRSSPSRA